MNYMDKELRQLWSEKLSAEKLKALESDLAELKNEPVLTTAAAQGWLNLRFIFTSFIGVFLVSLYLLKQKPETYSNTESYTADISALIYLLDDSELFEETVEGEEIFIIESNI